MEKEFMDFRAKGSFFAEIRKNGKVIETIEKHNLVVNTSCSMIAKLLAGAAVSIYSFDNQISKIKCGIDNDSSGYPDDMVSSIDKTNLDGTVYEKNIILSDGNPNPDSAIGGFQANNNIEMTEINNNNTGGNFGGYNNNSNDGGDFGGGDFDTGGDF